MDTRLQETLKKIVDEYGKEVLLEEGGRRAVGLALDFLPQAKREIRLLRSRLEAGLAGEIYEDILVRGVDYMLYRSRYILRLCDELDFERSVAAFLVNCICTAFGIEVFDEAKEPVLEDKEKLMRVTDPDEMYEILKEYTVIGSHAFEFCECPLLKIPANIRLIQRAAFTGSYSQKVIFSEEAVIEPGAFDFFHEIHTVEFPPKARYFVKNGCIIEKQAGMLIGTGVWEREFRPSRFSEIEGAVDISIPEEVLSIPGCSVNDDRIGKISLSRKVREIDVTQLRSVSYIEVDPENPYYKSVDGVLFDQEGTGLLLYPWRRPGEEYRVPEKTKSIGEKAFFIGGELTCLDLRGSQIVKIGKNALQFFGIEEQEQWRSFFILDDGNIWVRNYCQENGIACGDVLKSPEEFWNRFHGNLNGIAIIEENALSDMMDSTVVIPASVKLIRKRAFADCISLKTIVLKGNTVVEPGAFEGCIELMFVDLVPDSRYVFLPDRGCMIDSWTKTLIYAAADDGICRVVGEVSEIPEGTIAGNAKQIYIPHYVEHISMRNFLGSELEAIHMELGRSGMESIDGVLYHSREKILLRYPAGRKESQYQIALGTERIRNIAFAEADYLQKVILNDGLRQIGAGAFLNCRALRVVRLSRELEKIEKSAFENCVSLTTIVIYDQVTEIEEDVFKNCGWKDGKSELTIVIYNNLYVEEYCRKHNIQYSKM